jgi:hypothetical protein
LDVGETARDAQPVVDRIPVMWSKQSSYQVEEPHHEKFCAPKWPIGAPDEP